MKAHRTMWRFAGALQLIVVSLVSSGCMFKMRHELPTNVYFSAEPRAEKGKSFEDEAMKNWALAGLVPYSEFGAKDLIPAGSGGELSSLSIETVFTGIDTVIWVVPGFFYGYYLWAPRHVKVEGEYIEDAAPVVRPTVAGPPKMTGRRRERGEREGGVDAR